MGNIEIRKKFSRLKSASSIDGDYLETATRDVLWKKLFLKMFDIYRKTTVLKSFLIKVQACKFIEKRLQHWCFSLHVRKFLRTTILENISKRLLLLILLLQEFVCLFIIIKKKWSLFRWRKSLLKLDYVIKWRSF